MQIRQSELETIVQPNDLDPVQIKAALAEATKEIEALRADLLATGALKEAFSKLSLAYDRLEEELEARHRARFSAMEAEHRSLALQGDELRKQAKDLKGKLKQVETSRAAMVNSTSWKITGPLRVIMRKIRGK